MAVSVRERVGQGFQWGGDAWKGNLRMMKGGPKFVRRLIILRDAAWEFRKAVQYIQGGGRRRGVRGECGERREGNVHRDCRTDWEGGVPLLDSAYAEEMLFPLPNGLFKLRCSAFPHFSRTVAWVIELGNRQHQTERRGHHGEY